MRVFCRVKVDAVVDQVGESAFLQALYQLNLFCNMIGCLAPDVRLDKIEPAHVLFERFGIEFRDIPNGLAFPLGTFLHFIFAHVGIRRQMPHVSNVHDVVDFKSVCHERSFQYVFKNIRPQVPDMRVIIDRRPAGIEAHGRGILWLEFLLCARERVVEFQHGLIIASIILFLNPAPGLRSSLPRLQCPPKGG